MSDAEESGNGTDPLNPDTDGDGVGDATDVFPLDPSESADTDGDGVGDNGDAFPNDPNESADSDGDGVGDNADALPNDPNETEDTDGDGVGNNADLDDDGDGLSDVEEETIGTDPLNPDTDGDGVSDGDEVASGSNPNMARTQIAWASVSTDMSTELAGVMVDPEQVAVDNLLGVVVLSSLGDLPPYVNVAGYHQLANAQLFSLDGPAVLGGSLVVWPGDVVRYDGTSYTIEFQGSDEGVSYPASVDAVSTWNGNLVLSFDRGVSLGSLLVDAEDLVQFDGSSFTLLFDGSAAGVPEGLNVDGAHVLGPNRLAVSFDGSGSLPGIVFADEDVVECDMVADTWEITYDGSAEHATWEVPNLDAVGLPPTGASCGIGWELSLVMPLLLMAHRMRGSRR